MRILSWNVNGLRALVKKIDINSYISKHNPDIFFLNETKLCEKLTINNLEEIYPYSYFSCSCKRKGYSGVAFYSKKEPLNIHYGMDIKKHDDEGRMITLEFKKFYLIGLYVPNSGQGLKRLDYRTTEWDKDFLKYVNKLTGGADSSLKGGVPPPLGSGERALLSLSASAPRPPAKPVIITGDLNVAHNDIDIHNPKSNLDKTAGFTMKERNNFSRLLDSGFIDTFRHLHPDKIQYSYWSYRFKSREKNKGWRLDYFLISKSKMKWVKKSWIDEKQLGSDHVPIILDLKNILKN